ncbi:MAG: TIGR03560 family F420-dependent LLM class oxidoreductase [Dehalococcoidia bacterium]
MTVRFGVHVGPQNMAMDDLRALWRELDQAGMDWISLWDHFYESPPVDGMGPHFEAIAAMAALAAETEQVRVGCLVFCVVYRNPALLAKALTTLDHVSRGRLEVGLGAGWHQMEFDAYGYEYGRLGRRLDMLEEAVQIIRGMLTQERTTFEGKHCSVVNATCQPPPVQERVPIWIGGTGVKRTLPAVARYADGWNAAYIPPEEFGRLSRVLNDCCTNEGRDPASVRRSVNLAFALGSDKARAAKIEEEARRQSGVVAERIAGGSLFGTPDDAADRIAQYIDAGAQDINVALRVPWDEAALRVYVEEVVPAMRKRFA